ncbi:MAG: NAD(P)/FAD-dependent oxidoreductase [Eubacterium sp.]|nr:NAD(P)/FAD-dependent oxidoreductase [Eubacterium sp.]
MKSYDVIFIGSGHSCWHGALILKMAGKSVALVERDLLGGTCTNYGCDAKILLDSPIELKEALERYEGIGLAQKAEVDWKSLMQYKKGLIGGMPDALSGMFDSMGFDVIRGAAKFVDSSTIEVAGEQYKAKKFVIGTGQTYVPMDVPGKEFMHDSREFLDLDEIPDHVTFIGGGIISMEFASICLSLGKQVDVITHGSKVLSAYPQKYVKNVVDRMKSMGANICFNTELTAIEEIPGGRYNVKCANDVSIETDYVLVAVGRKANAEGMNLEGIGVDYSDRGIRVDGHMRTAVKNIYASGDVVDKSIPKLTPTAEFESNYIAMDILNPFNKAIDYPPIPNLVFTLPRIAQVGVDVDKALASAEYRVEEVPIGETMVWLNKANKDEHITYVFDRSNHLVGAAVYGDEAGSYIDVLTLIINRKMGVKELSKMIFAFPTPTYGLISSLIPMFLKKN